MDIENIIFEQKLAKLVKKDRTGKEYIQTEDLNKLNLNPNEKNFIYNLLVKKNIIIIPELERRIAIVNMNKKMEAAKKNKRIKMTKKINDQFILFNIMNDASKPNEIRKKARKQLIEQNMKLARYVARSVFGSVIFSNDIDINELNSFACEGLIVAIDNFDINEEVSFTTYAYRCITNVVSRYLKRDLGFRYLEKYYEVYFLEKRKIEDTLGYSIEDGPETIYLIVEKIKEQFNLNDESTTNLLNNLLINILGVCKYDWQLETSKDLSINNGLMAKIDEVLSELSPKEEEILRLRFGFDDSPCKTLEEIGQMFGVTRERIRQIESRALKKLRQPSYSNILKDYC